MRYADYRVNEAIGCHWRSGLEALCFKNGDWGWVK